MMKLLDQDVFDQINSYDKKIHLVRINFKIPIEKYSEMYDRNFSKDLMENNGKNVFICYCREKYYKIFYKNDLGIVSYWNHEEDYNTFDFIREVKVASFNSLKEQLEFNFE